LIHLEFRLARSSASLRRAQCAATAATAGSKPSFTVFLSRLAPAMAGSLTWAAIAALGGAAFLARPLSASSADVLTAVASVVIVYCLLF
jgi:hypothetical protein